VASRYGLEDLHPPGLNEDPVFSLPL
jgi:hypothetical protein